MRSELSDAASWSIHPLVPGGASGQAWLRVHPQSLSEGHIHTGGGDSGGGDGTGDGGGRDGGSKGGGPGGKGGSEGGSRRPLRSAKRQRPPSAPKQKNTARPA